MLVHEIMEVHKVHREWKDDRHYFQALASEIADRLICDAYEGKLDDVDSWLCEGILPEEKAEILPYAQRIINGCDFCDAKQELKKLMYDNLHEMYGESGYRIVCDYAASLLQAAVLSRLVLDYGTIAQRVSAYAEARGHNEIQSPTYLAFRQYLHGEQEEMGEVPDNAGDTTAIPECGLSS